MKLNTLRIRVVGIVAALALAYWLTSAVFSGKGPQAGDFKIFAAGHVEAGKAEVRLRWIMKTGWLPEGGFNLYRSEGGGKEILLNAGPLGANPGKIADSPWKTPPVTKGIQGTSKAKLQYSYQEALQSVRANQDKLPAAIFSLQPPKRLPSSFSAKAFLALKQQREKLFHPPETQPKFKPGATIVGPDVTSYPDLATYYDYLGRDQAAQRKPMVLVKESPAIMLRTHLVMGAFLHPNTIGADLGLAFTDTKVEAGKKYHYVLKVADKGKQIAVAESDVVVENAPPLAAPTGLTGFQFDATTVSLRWDRIDPTDSTGLVSFNLYRIDKNNPAPGKQVNQLPILIRDIPIRAIPKGQDATHVEPMIFFHDTTAGSAAPGDVTYKLIAVDMFGRRSHAASATVKLEDLVTPPAVLHFAAERSAKTGKVQFIWTALTEPDVSYTLSRIDRETQKEEMLAHTRGNDLPALLPEYPGLNSIVNPPKRGLLKGDQAPKQKSDLLPQKSAWLAFTDTPPEDHYFVYKITTVFKNHPRSSPPQFSVEILVPSLKAPASPVVQGSFVPADKLPKSVEHKAEPKLQKPGLEKAHDHALLKSPEFRSTKPADAAGAARLTWNAVANAYSYRIYRASGTEFRPSAKDKPADPKDPQVKVGDKGTFHYRAEIPDSELKDGQYALVGQVNETTEFYDYFSRSPAHVYWYRVVAVNRWGVPGANATAQHWSKAAKVRVPSTVPPSTPILVAAVPDYAGNIALSLNPPALLGGKVTYHVYRGEAPTGKRAIIKDHKEVLKDQGQRKVEEIVLVDKLVQSGRTYEYYVIADNGETPPTFSAASNRLRASTYKALVIAPTGVDAVKKGTEIHIEWKGVANTAGYIVERALGGPKGEFAQISDLQAKTSFVDRTPGTAGPTYTYRVIAVDNAGNVSNPNDYPLNQQQKDPSKYPAQATITVK